jgi:hypothetical protein
LIFPGRLIIFGGVSPLNLVIPKPGFKAEPQAGLYPPRHDMFPENNEAHSTSTVLDFKHPLHVPPARRWLVQAALGQDRSNTRPSSLQVVEDLLYQRAPQYPPNAAPTPSRRPWGKVAAPSFALVWDDEVQTLPPLTWDVEQLVPHGGLVVVYGEPGSGKTFLALNLAFAIATGSPWLGHSVRQGPVVYVYAEGAQGLFDRVKGLRAEYGLHDRAGIAFLPQPIQLLDSPKSVIPFADAIEAQGVAPAVIVIDTLSRNTAGGKENSQEDMSQAVSACDYLRTRFGSTVILPHHSRRGDDELRGSSVLAGAVDTSILVKRQGDRMTLKCTKQRNASEFVPLSLNFTEKRGTRILTAATAQERMPASAPALLHQLQLSDTGQGCTNTAWCEATIVSEGISRRTFQTSRKWLVENGYVQQIGDARGYALTEKGRQEVQVQPSAKRVHGTKQYECNTPGGSTKTPECTTATLLLG